MLTDIQRAMLGDHDAAARLTDAGVLVPCPFCGNDAVVHKVFSGCPACNDRRCTSCRCFGWYKEVCRQCENQSGYQPLKFCPHCGKPLRDEAAEMVIERLEALKDG